VDPSLGPERDDLEAGLSQGRGAPAMTADLTDDADLAWDRFVPDEDGEGEDDEFDDEFGDFEVEDAESVAEDIKLRWDIFEADAGGADDAEDAKAARVEAVLARMELDAQREEEDEDAADAADTIGVADAVGPTDAAFDASESEMVAADGALDDETIGAVLARLEDRMYAEPDETREEPSDQALEEPAWWLNDETEVEEDHTDEEESEGVHTGLGEPEAWLEDDELEDDELEDDELEDDERSLGVGSDALPPPVSTDMHDDGLRSDDSGSDADAVYLAAVTAGLGPAAGPAAAEGADPPVPASAGPVDLDDERSDLDDESGEPEDEQGRLADEEDGRLAHEEEQWESEEDDLVHVTPPSGTPQGAFAVEAESAEPGPLDEFDEFTASPAEHGAAVAVMDAAELDGDDLQESDADATGSARRDRSNDSGTESRRRVVLLACLFFAVAVGAAVLHFGHTSGTSTPVPATTPVVSSPAQVARLESAITDVQSASTGAQAGLTTLSVFPTPPRVATIINPYVDSLHLYDTLATAVTVPTAARAAAFTAETQVRQDIAFLRTVNGLPPIRLGAYISSFFARSTQLQQTMDSLQKALSPSAH
jgi:hypothetical protein